MVISEKLASLEFKYQYPIIERMVLGQKYVKTVPEITNVTRFSGHNIYTAAM